LPPSSPVLAVSPGFTAKQHKRRGEILTAALRAFRERGYHAVTLDDIAGKIGVRKTALYHYFADKESILYECHRMSLAELGRLRGRARDRFDSPAERLRFMISEHVHVMTETLHGPPSAFEVSSLSPEHQRKVIAGRDEYERALRNTIQEGMDGGVFRPVDPKVAAFVILGAINWIARWYSPGGSSDSSALGREYAEHLVGGLTCQ